MTTLDPDQTPVADAPKNRILLVEDHGATVFALGTLLRRWGFDVTSVPSGEAALECARSHRYDAVVSDIDLGGTVDGYDVMHELSSVHKIPGIAVTGSGQEDDIHQSLRAGFSDHLTKPVNSKQLRAALDRILAETKT